MGVGWVVVVVGGVGGGGGGRGFVGSCATSGVNSGVTRGPAVLG